MKVNKVFVGYDTRLPLPYAVTARSILKKTRYSVEITPLLLPHLQAQGLYVRETVTKDGQMFDTISDAPMSTEFAISRFLIPYLCDYQGFAVFCDSDFLFRSDIQNLFDLVDPSKAVQCVKHDYRPKDEKKMDGQIQTQYSRKNWSSLMIFNCGHPSNYKLDLTMVNTLPGRDLHAFSWLQDDEIGDIPPLWNWLEGHNLPTVGIEAVHYTRGTPDMAGYENTQHADEWRNIAGEMMLCKMGN
jgi:hypothetical protein